MDSPSPPADRVDPADPADLSAGDARRLIGARRLTAEALLEACLARIEAVNPAVNAFVALDRDGARAEAQAADRAVAAGEPLGALHGLPVAIKDMTDVAGLPTTYGSTAHAGIVAEADDPMVVRLRAAGAVILGKTNVPEWSAGANTRNAVYGVTANPYDVTRSCAGSSGGSAVALACGMAPLATGSDLGGSLRSPAAYCGVVGFRPSFGVVPSPARECALLPFATQGPMGRTVADAALLLSVQAVADLRDPWSREADGVGRLARWALPRVDLAGLRVAASADLGFALTEAVVREAFGRAVERLSPAFGTVTQAAPDCRGADTAFAVLRALGFLGQHQRLLNTRPDDVGPNVNANIAEGLGYNTGEVADAFALQAALQRRWLAFFDDVDVLLTPTVSISPRDWHELYPAAIDGRATESYYHWLQLAYAVTLAGHPAVSVPAGMDGNGLPFGLQVIGRRGADVATLAVAGALEEAIGADAVLRPVPPDLAALRSAPPLAEAEGFLGFG